jgi:hypothetical protein
MRFPVKTLMALSSLLLCSTANAQTIGYGNVTCAQFAKDYAASANSEIVYYAWGEGFMSAANTANLALKLPTRALTEGEAAGKSNLAALRSYCDGHPSEPYERAVMHLYLSLPVLKPK